MVALSRTEDQLAAALKVVEESDASVIEKAEMLMEDSSVSIRDDEPPLAVESDGTTNGI